jgi:hypothetical protein
MNPIRDGFNPIRDGVNPIPGTPSRLTGAIETARLAISY